MATNKPEPDGQTPRHRPRRTADRPDRQAMEGMTPQVVAGLQDPAPQDTPSGQDQALLYRALQERDEQRPPGLRHKGAGYGGRGGI